MKRSFQLDQINEVAKEVLQIAPSKVLCLYGDMGVGKTTLVKALVKELGAIDLASSPTFGLVNEYSDQNNNPIAYHFDFYRLNDEIEAFDIGFEDYLGTDEWLFIEWPEKISSLLPENAVSLFLHFVEENTRSIELNIT
ncbi:tRNA (adenosine(37)-N6)-threonylcarbamoyltransferase complex ATPase subunit type 1 TsaE [Allomuricauda sp. F6463D]|uniref:tRNA (adenosine(37)-N6)-threonylcarbamoyltransferase complex ATPase subunit type 1 TsaE n=1 Tax=Allomuricauda sp. F6463D TaxID=2926409 RepID=UPI001FF14652|nr:tRNA (adenosine(37)-N6)-threonylcarbamoyltransferase complex ATPase subunit type 1 TsaE [Muricauda sp. F6463D]MCK0159515.1 tRNA (adenosine(37)-N6)-threonylcarbamoyltransferase complex ATPase subunit type 1 TsaE [Muricauda sp. F6463D]